MKKVLATLFLLFLIGCVGKPENVEVIDGFELDRYLGKWYEIARLNHSFEEGLSNVTASYSLMEDDDGVNVLNKGYNDEDDEWNEADGVAYFVGDKSKGELKVSFFKPFYGGYNVIALDKKDYQYSLVCGPNRSYLWVLSRTPKMEKPLLDSLVNIAKELKFNTDELIYVDQGKHTSTD